MKRDVKNVCQLFLEWLVINNHNTMDRKMKNINYVMFITDEFENFYENTYMKGK